MFKVLQALLELEALDSRGVNLEIPVMKDPLLQWLEWGLRHLVVKEEVEQVIVPAIFHRNQLPEIAHLEGMIQGMMITSRILTTMLHLTMLFATTIFRIRLLDTRPCQEYC